jgi:hypothetical protein
MKAIIVAVVSALLVACSGMTTRPAIPSTRHKVEFGFTQFAPNGVASCRKYGPGPQAAPLPAMIFSWFAGRIVTSMKKAADREIKRYASERQSDVKYIDFYDASKWSNLKIAGEPLALSCFVASQVECDLAADAPPEAECPQANRKDPRLVIEGAFVRSAGWMKVFTTKVDVRGIASEKHSSNPKDKAAIAATMSMEAVWVDGLRGRQEKLFETSLFKDQFVPDFDSPVNVLDTASDDAFAARLVKANPLPLPPKSSAGITQIAPSVRVAEVSKHPVVLDWIASFLESEKDDLSKALADAIDSI